MAKGNSNIFRGGLLVLLFTVSQQLHAQIEVITPDDEDEKEVYYDSVPPTATFTVQERRIPDSLIAALKADDAFWYANAAPAQKKEAPAKEAANLQWLREKWVRVLLWFIILGSFVAVLAWYLSTLNIRLFRKPSAAISDLPDASLTEDIFSIDYNNEIEKALKNGNFQQAVRLYYLQTLRKLSDKNLIKYGQDVTNSEYVGQLYPTPFYKDFFRLTRHFEYIWYGGFALAPAAFEMVQKEFETFHKRLPV